MSKQVVMQNSPLHNGDSSMFFTDGCSAGFLVKEPSFFPKKDETGNRAARGTQRRGNRYDNLTGYYSLNAYISNTYGGFLSFARSNFATKNRSAFCGGAYVS